MLDGAGREIKGSEEAGSLALSATLLKPGAEFTLTGSDGSEWINIKEWGFDLRTPDIYSVEGRPASNRTRTFSESRSDSGDAALRSNQTSFKIEG